MIRNRNVTTAALLSVIAGLTVYALAKPAAPASPAIMPAATMPAQPASATSEDDKNTVALASIPEPTRATALKLAGDAKNITRVLRETDEDIVTYEVEFTENGVACAAIITAAGEVMELERTVPAAALPKALAAAIASEYKSGTVGEVHLVTKTYYEVKISKGGKTVEIKGDASGNIEDEAKDDADDKNDGKDDAKPKDKMGKNEKGEKGEKKWDKTPKGEKNDKPAPEKK